MSVGSQLGLRTLLLSHRCGQARHDDSPPATSWPRCSTGRGQPADFPPMLTCNSFRRAEPRGPPGRSNVTGAGGAACSGLFVSQQQGQSTEVVFGQVEQKPGTEDSGAKSPWRGPFPAGQHQQMNVDLGCQHVRP